MTEYAAVLTEARFQAMVVELATTLGLACYHTHDSRRSEKGWPDLVIVGENGVLYRELKTTRGKLTLEQMYWLAILHHAGHDVGVWRPDLWPTQITRELRELGSLTIRRPVRRPTRRTR